MKKHLLLYENDLLQQSCGFSALSLNVKFHVDTSVTTFFATRDDFSQFL